MSARRADAPERLPGAGETSQDPPAHTVGVAEVPATDRHTAPDVKRFTFHMIGHAHIDPVWLWQWQEGFQEIKQTWRSALDRMREFPEFRFTASSAAFYEWVEENEPAMFAEIRQRVAEGRWSFVGWWVEPDVNVPSGESFVRQALYAQRYFEERFGRTTSVGFNPDGFGHSAGLPQILRKSGLPYYVFMRPQAHEMDLPRIFRWRAGDGTEVVAFRIMFEYGTWVPELEPWIRRSMPELGELSDELMVFYGVGNHGGGPTRANLESLRRLDGVDDVPSLERSTPERFFERLTAADPELPVVIGEFQNHATGCYAAHSGVKRWNRQAESLLAVAERWSAVAATVSGMAYPRDALTRAWKDVLFNQFHDVLAGTAIEPAYDDVRDAYGEAMTIAGRALNHATQSIARRIAIEPDESSRPIVVFNPHAWPARLDVELEYGGLQQADGLVDDVGGAVPFQSIRSRATVKGGRSRISFIAELPALGFRVYRMLPVSTGADRPRVEATTTSLDNGRLRLEVDPETGAIRRLIDRRSGHDVLSGPAGQGIVIVDSYDTWGHGMRALDQVEGTFASPTIRLVEHGPVKSVLRVESEYGGSRLIQDITMYGRVDRVDVECTVTWNERWRALKLRFPVAVEDPVATYEVAYATLERPTDGREAPAQRWVDVSGRVPGGGQLGLSLLNDGKYSFDTTGSELGLTVLRSPVYAHHEPYLPLPEGHYVWQDQGTQHFRYALLPHAGDWRTAGTPRAAAELNERAISLVETSHDGDLPLRQSFIHVEPEDVVVTVVKLAERGDDMVVRLFETSGRPRRATMRLPVRRREVEVSLAAGELKTLLVPSDPAAPVREADLLERPVGD